MYKFVNENEQVMPFAEVREWIKRLESGDYKHMKGTLYMGDTKTGKKRMCCLGVLADMHGANWEKNDRYNNHLCSLNNDTSMYTGKNGILADHVLSDSENDTGYNLADELAEINDAMNTNSYRKVITAIKQMLLPREAA